MDGRLFEVIYNTIRSEYSPLNRPRRAGRPRMYGTDEILLVWAFAVLMNWPISVARRKLLSHAAGRMVAPAALVGEDSRACLGHIDPACQTD